MQTCPFCAIAADLDHCGRAWETETLIVFADHRPIRSGHMQIVTKDHYEVFDDLPTDLASEMIVLGQRIARAQKVLFGVERVGFVLTGNEVAHVHAHVLPLFQADDITSARFFDGNATFVSPSTQFQSAQALSKMLEDQTYG
ncbi:HIT family protein [Shimia ponticola]|uniref:HIT family protein n=1 Tax=Shimia ponticola TaxID=2582893 RepID=UPI00164BABE9|nr:HIT family protein [Shimia ponticola]